MIRLATLEDFAALLALADILGLFSSDELGELRQQLADTLGQAGDGQPFWLIDDGDPPVGLAYCEPERMTSGTWNLQLIAVHPAYRQQGRGAQLLHSVEQILARRGARLLLVETMGTTEFESARRLYRRSGYSEEARIREFYAAGADKIIFRKLLPKDSVSF